MEPLCEFCAVVRAVVYCKSDHARLCLHCDNCVHSANALSRRHHRSLLCDRCNDQPAIIRCVDEKMCVCQACDWNCNTCAGRHKRQVVLFYNGCPSLAEFSDLFNSLLDEPPCPSGFGDPGWGGSLDAPAASENCAVGNRKDGGSYEMVLSKLRNSESCVKIEPWLGTSSIVPPNGNCGNQTPLSAEESILCKVHYISPFLLY